MHQRARRALSVALSTALHALLLLYVYSWTLVQPGFPEQKLLPVRIIEPKPPAPAPKAAAPAVRPPPPPVAKAPEPPPAVEPAPPAPPPAPEKKIPLPEQQIVSPPDAGKNEPPPPDTRLLSDQDTHVEEQMVKRGQPKPGDESPGKAEDFKAAQAPKSAKPQRGRGGERSPQVAALPGLDRLMPDALRLAEEGYGTAELARAQEAEEAQQPRRDAHHADGLWIPPSGPTGTLDFLPDVREGNITLLNTKAEVFAPFVRRVAVRVFQNFWISLRRDLGSSTLPTLETVEAEAVMDPRGEMILFTINRRSTRISMASDRRLQQACNDGFFDRNPPPGARAADGNIHFILRTNVELGPSPNGWGGFVQFTAGLL